MQPIADAVIPAAGVGRRMGGAVPKQYLKLGGIPVLERTARIFLKCPKVRKVIIPISRDDGFFASLPIASDPRVEACEGGSERFESVIAGLARCKAPFVLVHDAARPLLSDQDLKRVLDAGTKDDDGAILAQRMADTVKLEEDGRCLRTVPRKALWRALTPQVFRTELLLKALEKARARGLEITDDASAMEAAGYRPRLVEASSPDFKITLRQDLALAEALVGDRT
ncbi:MAG: 2-C-methyl-D-erythritol 4-phosphate cytidylyltransferase [Aeromonadales bacterium]|nr:2-C-methyl-D-erythritol 4-phosphate cytidylyltransferase [Aeromonadales bacterium]MDY2890122.1 2-C-methyl-D-erythritol 4-phosphate cytidylyltransferase [Succinivibrio sp.]